MAPATGRYSLYVTGIVVHDQNENGETGSFRGKGLCAPCVMMINTMINRGIFVDHDDHVRHGGGFDLSSRDRSSRLPPDGEMGPRGLRGSPSNDPGVYKITKGNLFH
jgi:hypothetical protein